MDTLQLRNVQISPADHSPLLRLSKHQLSASNGALSFVSVSRLQGSGRGTLLLDHQSSNLFMSKDASFPTSKIWCCAPAHPPLNECPPAAVSLNQRNFNVNDEQTLLLKKMASKITPDLRDTCIYLVGMMGSGKSTVGHVLADALGYRFVDSDKVIEEKNNGMSVAEFFSLQKESTFRDEETKVLKELSSDRRLVVGTGGGIVIRPENWSYLRYGLTIWLDVPLEALAERVVAAGTHSRPLLGGEMNGDSAYSKALATLTTIFDNRESCYAKADARVSVKKLASSLGYCVRDLTPTLIAIQALEEMSNVLTSKKTRGH